MKVYKYSYIKKFKYITICILPFISLSSSVLAWGRLLIWQLYNRRSSKPSKRRVDHRRGYIEAYYKQLTKREKHDRKWCTSTSGFCQSPLSPTTMCFPLGQLSTNMLQHRTLQTILMMENLTHSIKSSWHEMLLL